jgi:hypothetical protein
MTQAELGALSDLGPDAIAKLEASRLKDRPAHSRAVSVRDLLALSWALNVSPLDILLPTEELAIVEVASAKSGPARTYESIWVRDWIAGLGPLDGADDESDDNRIEEYFQFAPEHIRRRHQSWRHPAVHALQVLETYVREAVANGGGDEPEALAEAIRRALRSVSRHAGTLAADIEDATPTGGPPHTSATRRASTRRQP